MIAVEEGFEPYLKQHEKLIQSVIRTIGYRVPEDREDMTIEAQRVLWTIFESPKKDGPKAYLRSILYNKLIDYLRETLPLSRSHLKSIKIGICVRPSLIGDSCLDEMQTNYEHDAIDGCIDVTFLLNSQLFQPYHREVIRLSIIGKSDQEITRTLRITKGSLAVYRWEIRQIYSEIYTNS